MAHANSSPSAPADQGIPYPIIYAIECQRGELGETITLVYALDSMLLRRENHGPLLSDQENAAFGWVEFSVLTALILEKLSSVQRELESHYLAIAAARIPT